MRRFALGVHAADRVELAGAADQRETAALERRRDRAPLRARARDVEHAAFGVPRRIAAALAGQVPAADDVELIADRGGRVRRARLRQRRQWSPRTGDRIE